MRVLLLVLMAAIFVGAGILFGAFNPQAIRIDFDLFYVPANLGVALLVALFIGAALGGMAVTISIVWPLKSRLRKLSREQAAAARQHPTSPA